MYKIQSVTRIEKDVLVKHPEAKEHIIKDMLVDFAHHMFKNKCFELTEKNVKGEAEWMGFYQQELKIETFILTHSEFKEVMALFTFIKSYYTDIPDSLKGFLVHLYSILTKQPIVDQATTPCTT